MERPIFPAGPPGSPMRLCRVASGGSFAVRQLYTDDDESIWSCTHIYLLRPRSAMTKARLFMTRQSGGPPTRRIPLRGIGGGYPARSRHGRGCAFETNPRGTRPLQPPTPLAPADDII